MYLLIIFSCITEIISIVSAIYSLIQLIRGRKKSMIKSDIFLFVGYTTFILAIIMFMLSFKNPDHINIIKNKQFHIYILIIYGNIICSIFLWTWSNWEFSIDNTYITYKKYFFGKIVIKISEIDKIKSTHLFTIYVKRKGYSSETLKIVDTNGKKMVVGFGLFTAGNILELYNKIISWKIKREIVEK